MLPSLLRISIAVAVTALLGAGCAPQRLAPDTASSTPPVDSTAAAERQWRYANEHEWIVSEILQGIVGMAHYARTGDAPPASALDVRVKTTAADPRHPVFEAAIPGRPAPLVLAVSQSILTPELYAPAAMDLLGPAAAAAAPPLPASESVTLAALTRPRTDVMVAESARVSSALAHRMTDAAAHEDAALLFAALSLREMSGGYYDTRRMLLRMTMHLALARGLLKDAPLGASGRLAEITLLTLSFQPQQEALQRLQAFDALPRRSPAARAWSRTLRMRNTEDWRLVPDPTKVTLLERREYVFWVNSKIDDTYGLQTLDTIDLDGLPDWGSIVMAQPHGVEAGARYVRTGVSEILADATAMPLGLESGWSTDPAAIAARYAEVLNQEPWPGPVGRVDGRTAVEVLDRGTWAAFVQRHVLHQGEHGVAFIEWWWGLPDEAKTYAQSITSMFGGLRFHPFFALTVSRDRTAHAAAVKAGRELVSRSPEHVSGNKWKALFEPRRFATDRVDVIPPEAWSDPWFPAGTYLEWPKRLWKADGHLRVRGAELLKIRQAMPHYAWLTWSEVESRLGNRATAADLKREYGALLDYDYRMMKKVAEASKDDPAEYARLYRKMGEQTPDVLSELAAYLVARGEADAGAAVWDDYFTRARDRVGASNQVRWLVDYHYDHGATARALEVAREAAEVYSGGGLGTLAHLYERMGRWPDALEYHQKIAQRYEGNDPQVLAFLLRHERSGRRSEAFDKERKALLRRFFPNGMEKLGENPTGPPADGVELVDAKGAAQDAGLRKGDVIVALDGWRVRSHDQYATVRALTTSSDMTMLVWRGEYVVVKPKIRNYERHIGTPTVTHRGPRDEKRKDI